MSPGAPARRLVASLALAIAASALADPPKPKRPGAHAMPTTQDDAQRARLRQLIAAGNAIEAEDLTRQLGSKATPVLLELEEAPQAAVRRQVLELAVIVDGEEECRLALRRLVDPDAEIRDLAVAQVPRCGRPALLGDLQKVARTASAALLGPLALAIGQAGSAADLPSLDLLRLRAKAPEAAHDVDLARAKLGHPAARGALVERLRGGDASARVEALRDCLYVGDRALARDFGPALADERDVTALTIPEEPPMRYARVADVAVFTMVQLGIKLSFEMPYLDRLEKARLDEARRWVQQVGGR